MICSPADFLVDTVNGCLRTACEQESKIRTVDFYLLCNRLKKIANGMRSVGPIIIVSVVKDKVGPGS